MRNSLASFVPVRYRAYPPEVRSAISHLIRTSPVPNATTVSVSCLEVNLEEVWVVRSFLAGIEIARVEPKVQRDEAA